MSGVKLLKLEALPHRPCTSTTGGLATVTVVFVTVPPAGVTCRDTLRVVSELSAVPREKFTGAREITKASGPGVVETAATVSVLVKVLPPSAVKPPSFTTEVLGAP